MQSGKNGDMNGDRKGPTPPLEERKVIITGTAEAQWKVQEFIILYWNKFSWIVQNRFMITLYSKCQFKGKLSKLLQTYFFSQIYSRSSRNFYQCQIFGLTKWNILLDQTMFCRTKNYTTRTGSQQEMFKITRLFWTSQKFIACKWKFIVYIISVWNIVNNVLEFSIYHLVVTYKNAHLIWNYL